MWRFERCNWKHLVNVPILYERRRSEYLAVRTGKQLTKMLRKPDKKTTTKDADKAIMRIWQDTAPHFAVAHRVIRDSLLKEAFPKDPPQSWLLVGDSTPWVVAARELWPDKPVKRIQAVEPNEEMAKAAKMLSNQPHIMYNSSIVDVIKAGNSAVGAFEVVVVAWHLNALSEADQDAAVAVLWGCLKKNGTMIIVEERTHGGLVA
ncbi:hypothetical protein M885DRAFT_237028 [Pelagophyceae sp. CCMP2097]|nr:hypothetical protein M885DRAFT_237028 [Pelagophyceae sp. CCMP2097]